MKLNKKLKKNRNKIQSTKERSCQFPGCDKKFDGNHVSKYCKIHNNTKYFKEKYNVILKKDSNNQIINHNFVYSQTVNFRCALKGCKNFFKINLLPRIFVYPKYCIEHRNEHKRKVFYE